MKNSLWLLLTLLVLIACNQTKINSSDLEERKVTIRETENASLTKEQIERRSRSMEYCKTYKIPTLENLPCIASESNVKIRTKEAIIQRAFALCYLGLKSEGLEKKHLIDFDKKYKISSNFTNTEKLYVFSESPTEKQATDANWRYESLHVLLWALGYVDTLKYPNEVCNVGQDVKIILDRTKEEFTSQSKLRGKNEILDQADLIYRIHWACVDSQLNNSEPPGGVNSSIVFERHYVLNWLINYMDQEWDDVTTDT